MKKNEENTIHKIENDIIDTNELNHVTGGTQNPDSIYHFTPPEDKPRKSSKKKISSISTTV